MFNLEYNRAKGVTLVELIMGIVLIGVLAAPAAYVVVHFVRHTVYLPNQLTTDMILEDIQDVLIEGDAAARGLRFSRALIAVSEYDLTLLNQNADTVRYRLDTSAGKLYRSVNSGPEHVIPYYLPSGVSVRGLNGALFTGYDATETVTAIPGDIRWITLGLVVQDGAGDVDLWEGRSEGLSAVYVPRFE